MHASRLIRTALTHANANRQSHLWADECRMHSSTDETSVPASAASAKCSRCSTGERQMTYSAAAGDIYGDRITDIMGGKCDSDSGGVVLLKFVHQIRQEHNTQRHPSGRFGPSVERSISRTNRKIQRAARHSNCPKSVRLSLEEIFSVSSHSYCLRSIAIYTRHPHVTRQRPTPASHRIVAKHGFFERNKNGRRFRQFHPRSAVAMKTSVVYHTVSAGTCRFAVHSRRQMPHSGASPSVVGHSF
jgi:hypothetical protein